MSNSVQPQRRQPTRLPHPWIVWWALNAITYILMKETQKGETYREEEVMGRQRQIGALLLLAMDYQQPPEGGRGKTVFFPRVAQQVQPC